MRPGTVALVGIVLLVVSGCHEENQAPPVIRLEGGTHEERHTARQKHIRDSREKFMKLRAHPVNPDRVTEEEYASAVQKLLSVYSDPALGPPEWTSDLPLMEPYLRQSAILYSWGSEERMEHVVRVATERLPTNADLEKFEKLFGFEKTAYEASSPNIAACFTTLFDSPNIGKDRVAVNVISVVPPSLDDRTDELRFWESLTDTLRNSWYANRMSSVFAKIAACAARMKSRGHRIDRVVIDSSVMGIERELAKAYPGFLLESMLRKAIAGLRTRVHSQTGLKIFLHKFHFSVPDTEPVMGSSLGAIVADVARAGGLGNVLFVSAANPYSLIGGGPGAWDAELGRRSAAAVQSWPASNPFLEFELVGNN